MANFRVKLNTTYENIKTGEQLHILTWIKTIQFGMTLLAEVFEKGGITIIPVADTFPLGEYKEIHNDRFGKE